MRTMNISLPGDMVDTIDSLVARMGYASRSEVVRGALRDFLMEKELLSKLAGQALAVVAITFDADDGGVAEAVNKLQHRYENLVIIMIHNHIGKTCLEVILARGEMERVRRFSEELEATRGVEKVKVMVALSFPK
jgi:CopG family nickel-responsive transcriptional regulator